MSRGRISHLRDARLMILLSALLGCGDSASHEADDDDGDAQSEEQTHPDEGGDDTTTDAADDGDAGARADAASAMDSAIVDDRLQPFEVGRRWTYARITLDGGSDAACMGSLESSISKTVTRDAGVGYEYLPTCFMGSVQMFLEGDDIWAYVNSASRPIHYAASPVEAGVTWSSEGTQYAWEAQDKVEVPAGSFGRCIRRTASSAPGNYIVFCRGVGLVLSESRTENARMELVSKNF
jgi:hypothetical protein